MTILLRFPRQTRWAFAGCAAFVAVGLLLALTPDGRVVGLACAAFFGGLPAMALLLSPREIEFGDSALTIQRRMLSPRQIPYRDITGYGISRITSRSGRLGWGSFENGYEVDLALQSLFEDGTISESQLDSDLLNRDLAGLDASLIGSVGFLGVGVLYVVVFFVGAPAWFWALSGWVTEAALPVAVYLVITGIAYAVIRRRRPR